MWLQRDWLISLCLDRILRQTFSRHEDRALPVSDEQA